MMKIWREKGMFNVSEQRLADQERAILKGNLHCYNKLTLSRWKWSLKVNYPKNNWKNDFSVQKMDMNIAYFRF